MLGKVRSKARKNKTCAVAQRTGKSIKVANLRYHHLVSRNHFLREHCNFLFQIPRAEVLCKKLIDIQFARVTTRCYKMDSPGSPRSTSSYHTAPRSPMSTAEDMDMSTLGSSYRSAVPMTEDIRQHIHIYLDEGLYYNAFVLLTDLVTSGALCPNSHKPIYAPAPLHIELMSALLIHPKHTNQASADDRAELASQSITFLRNVLAILGPLNANLADAFSYATHVSSRTLRRSRHALELDEGSSGSDTEDGFERMRGVIANRGRIRNCAKDFWHMVGWAFNCSVKYPNRWKYWKVWLDFMLDVLDADWRERARLGSDADLDNSLLLNYLSEVRGRSSAMKRVVRSAFAAGSFEDLKEFPEVFPNETKELKAQNGQKRKRGDPMNRNPADFDESSSAELTDQASQDEDDTEDIDPWIGGPESIVLRQRVVTLVSHSPRKDMNRTNFIGFGSFHGRQTLFQRSLLTAKTSMKRSSHVSDHCRCQPFRSYYHQALRHKFQP